VRAAVIGSLSLELTKNPRDWIHQEGIRLSGAYAPASEQLGHVEVVEKLLPPAGLVDDERVALLDLDSPAHPVLFQKYTTM
jgi:hypothetical protein